MFSFITFLRAIAACLITNSHYTGIYPTDLLANGGLLGDVLFFAISGYCLSNVKDSFHKWYGKRLYRCYLPVLIATVVYMLLGAYSLKTQSLFEWYIYPTYYHFIASIVVLYIPFYIVMSVKALKRRLHLVIFVTATVHLLMYILIYDKSYYHIDNVREPMIRFLYFESMLLGSYFRENNQKYYNRFSVVAMICSGITLAFYFSSKMLFSREMIDSSMQIANQMILLLLLFFLFSCFAGMDVHLSKTPKVIRICVDFIAKRTLEIYVVQYVLIDWLRPRLSFPLNWLVLSASILIAASIVHWICSKISATFLWIKKRVLA